MNLAAPEWFVLVPFLLLAAWRWPGLGLGRPLRAGALLAIVLVLVHPRIRLASDGLDLWVLVDRSQSAAGEGAARYGEWQSILESSKSSQDRLFFIDYAENALRRDPSAGTYSGTGTETRTALAARYALSLMEPGRISRMLVLTDGYSTEPLGSVAEPLLQQGISLDYRLLQEKAAVDYQVARFVLPPRVQMGEAFLVEAEVTGERDAVLPFLVERDGTPAMKGEVAVKEGRGRVRLSDRVLLPGAHSYVLRLQPGQDAHPENNRAQAWLEVTGGPRVLLLSGYAGDPLGAMLRAQGFQVEEGGDLARLNPGSLAGVKVVVLNNIPAHKLPPDFLKALDFYVREQGGGLWMAGGKYSFGSGGYFQSAVDELLPVSMELRKEHRKLSVAMSIVMDRSGSMTAPVEAGGRSATKMDLANEGAARAVELLGEIDSISVFAVDSEAHKIVSQTEVGPSRGRINQTVRRITSGGGGIFVYNGLRAGWDELKKAPAGQRHLILFADAADSEEPGDYKELLAEMVKAGATVSVIGLGSEKDSDADLLRDVADRGKGRIFFNANAAELPALFAQETVAVSRSAFIEEPVRTAGTAGWMEIAAKPMSWLPEVDGYNLSYARPEATVALLAEDEYKAPLVAFWQRGIGRTAAVSFPMGGSFSQRARSWPQYGDFVQTLGRWLMGERVPPGLGLRTTVEGNRLTLDLFCSAELQDKIQRPAAVVAEGVEGKARALAWEKIEPGRFSASLPLPLGGWVRGAVQAGPRIVLPFGPVSSGVNAEWTRDRARLDELKTLSRRSGGREWADLSRIWDAPRNSVFRDVRPHLLVLLLLLVLADALATRMGWRMWSLDPRKTAGAR